MAKGRSAKQTSEALSKFVVACGKLRAKSINIWSNSSSINVRSVDERSESMHTDAHSSRTVVVPAKCEHGNGGSNEESDKIEVNLTFFGSRKWKPPKKPTSYTKKEISEFGSIKDPDNTKFKSLDQFYSFRDILLERLVDPYHQCASATIEIKPSRKSAPLGFLVRNDSDCGKLSRKLEHIHVEVEWYTYRGWHDKEPAKDLWI